MVVTMIAPRNGEMKSDPVIHEATTTLRQARALCGGADRRHTNELLDRLAMGYDCPRCGASTDTPCSTASGLPHQARVDRAVARYQAEHRHIHEATETLAHAIMAEEGLRRLTSPHDVKEGDWIVLKGTQQDWQVGKISHPHYVPVHAFTNGGRHQTKILSQQHFDTGRVHKRV